MWYMPYLRVRRAVLVYALLAVAISCVAIALHFTPGHVDMNGGRVNMADLRIDFPMLLIVSASIVGGFATILGLNLAAENDGHLELAWTKPVSREGYALGVFAVDIAALAVAIVITVLCVCVVTDVYLGHQAIFLSGPGALVRTLAFCGFPLCIYAYITALSAALRRNRGTIAGLFWPIMLACLALSFIPIPAVHAVAEFLNTFNPLAIFASGANTQPSYWTYLWGWGIAAMLLCIAVVTWRRLDA